MKAIKRVRDRKTLKFRSYMDGGMVIPFHSPSSSVGDEPPSEEPPNYEELLMRQVFKESSFNPEAVSSAGARGLAQITSITEGYLKEKGLIDEDFDPFNASHSMKAQRAYMDNLMGRSWNKGSEEVRMAKALSGYNFGPTATVRVLNEAKEKGIDIYNSLDWIDMLPEETKDYISKILLESNEDFESQYSKAREAFEMPE
tara:strand:- start:1150 stop:1749 length:600 start_codon:yes stop_codon:yes gene_type:complete